MDSSGKLRQYYPTNDHELFQFQVDEGVTVPVRITGNPEGLPVIYMHGGPGSTLGLRDALFFDPAVYKVVLMQQRGTEGCHPCVGDPSVDLAVFQNVTLETLTDDMDKLRRHLGHEKWFVFGGSWGSTVSLCYAQRFPANCRAVCLCGLFLCSKEEMEYFYTEQPLREQMGSGWDAAVFHRLLSYPAAHGCTYDACKYSELMAAYNTLLTTQKDAKAARIWSAFERWVEEPSKWGQAVLCDDDSVAATQPEDVARTFWQTKLFAKDPCLLHPSKLVRAAAVPLYLVQGEQDSTCPAAFVAG
eukprot:CAMPEP_0177667850 /NCGR_PEP_ID=MMETSP0447-20121125/22369_1 /TAXON_ID=0 /ORGANISM="Stygamoeba regulata, Strain BSH-02190019" /LENGTH=300 /DNA_ID=CAMNT_0019174161 /DNA_START=239 /DNA_END=1137 /DNA_ORIENTATION=+